MESTKRLGGEYSIFNAIVICNSLSRLQTTDTYEFSLDGCSTGLEGFANRSYIW